MSAIIALHQSGSGALVADGETKRPRSPLLFLLKAAATQQSCYMYMAVALDGQATLNAYMYVAHETNHRSVTLLPSLSWSSRRMPHRDGARRPRPASAAAVSTRLADGRVAMESMIQAAHQHLAEQSPPRSGRPGAPRRRRDNQDAEVTSDTVRLADHMDSFPLVPLPVIPQLGIADLEKVERGLNELLGSLMPHESEQQLGRYAARQLALVHQHLTQQRAQERVFHMLRGDLPVSLAPIATPSLRKSSSAAAAVKIGSTPRSAPQSCSSVSAVGRPPALRSGGSSQSWKSKKAVAMARAMVQANATRRSVAAPTTGFVISAGENTSRKRRRPRAVPRTPEQEAQYLGQQLERERESRRQAAYQRLLARQELQAKRKLEQKRATTEKCGESKGSNEGEATQERGGSDSDCESEASDVSNCSESDEANEQAILALDVQTEAAVEDGDGPGSESDGDGNRADDSSRELAADGGCGAENSRAEGASVRLVVPDASEPRDQEPGGSSSIDAKTAVQALADKTGEAPQEAEHVKPAPEGELTQQQHDDEAMLLNLQHFITSRAAAKLQQLKAEKEVRGDDAASVRTPRAATSSAKSVVSEACSPSSTADEKEGTTHTVIAPDTSAGNDSTPAESPSDPATDEKPRSWMDEVRQSAEEARANAPASVQASGRALSLPRAPVAECRDYRFYFSNFHCVLTSVFEQSRSSASSSSSLYHRPVGAPGDHTMRLQQKLYESWQSIMQDYATVFGPKIVAPEGMVPAAAATPWAPHYRINSTARKEVSEIVTQALQRLGGAWEEHPSGLGLKTTWNLLWTWSKPRVERQTLLAWQKVNHFQHAKALTRKDCLKKHIGKYLAAGGRLRQAFDIIPPTFLLPKEYVAFVQAFQERSERLKRSGFSADKNIWIMKPVALSRGRGISLVNDLSQVVYGEQVVIQEYIANPRLLDGFKFDLRLYVLVTSFNPLEAFLYDEGFVRLCTRPYEDGDLSNIFVHLTNSSIQKDNEEAITGSSNPVASVLEQNNEGSATQKDAGGTKTTLAYLWRRLAAEGVDVEQVKRGIEEVVLKALLCGEDQIPFQVNSFDLLGYDILLDADLRPWLIEINSSPSMARDHELDFQVKDAMMLDTLRVVDPLHFDRAKLAEVMARRQRDVEDEKRRPHAHTRHPREAEELAARQLNEDLTAILRGKLPRAYGEMPETLGSYRRLCPHTTVHNQLVKLKRSCLRKA
jgi:hypothetical protein